MPRSWLRLRFAVVTAAIMGLLVSGIAVGAAGSALIIGSQTNNAGTSDTQLITNSNVIAFKLLQNGPGTALMGYATPTSGATRGVYGRSDSPAGFGVQARNSGAAGSGAAIQAFGGVNNAILAESDNSTAITGEAKGCSGFFCGANGVYGSGWGFGVGVYGDGANGFAGVLGTSPIWGLYGIDASTDGSGLALYASGDVEITGDLTVSGVCTGCTLATMAINGGSTSLVAGDAVTIRGIQQKNGQTVLLVDKAKKGDAVVGLVANGLSAKSRENAIDGKKLATTWRYLPTSGSVKAGGLLSIVTSGVLKVASVDASGGAVAVGDALSVGAKDGKLSKRGADGSTVGYALGKVGSGTATIAVYVAPR